MRYLRRYKGENNWEEISREEMVEKLGRYYRNPEDIVKGLESEEFSIIETPYAEYKVQKEVSR